MPNKILFCANIDDHFRSFHLPYMEWFHNQGWEVHVAANGRLNLPFVSQKFDLPIRRSPFHFDNWKAYRTLKSIIANHHYQIIHCHTPLGGALARLSARNVRKEGTRVIYTAHGFHFYQGAPRLNWLTYYPVEKALAHLTDCLITVNEEDYTLARRKKFRAMRVEHVHGVGVNTQHFHPANVVGRLQSRKRFGYQPGEYLLFYAAEFNPNKNHRMLIQVLASVQQDIPEARLLLAGDGPLLTECRKQAARLGVLHKVDFLGYRNDVSELLPMCDVAVFASLREGMPVNMMEAMACGLPIIAVCNRGSAELIVDRLNGFLVSRGDVASFSQRLLELYQTEALQQKMGEESVKRMAPYSLNEVSKELIKIYARYGGEVHESESEPNRAYL